MEARKKKMRIILAAAAVGMVVLLAAVVYSGRRGPLTAQEQKCVGNWSFLASAPPNTEIVYYLAADGSACEEHYYLTSATPKIARLRMFGQWSVNRSGQLVIEGSEGVAGSVHEVARWTRELMGDQQSDFPMLRRIFKIQSVSGDAITVTANRSGGGGLEEIVMRPFVAPLQR